MPGAHLDGAALAAGHDDRQCLSCRHRKAGNDLYRHAMTFSHVLTKSCKLMAANDEYHAAFSSAKNPRDRASARRNLGVVSAAQGDLAICEKLFKKATKLLSASVALGVMSLQECAPDLGAPCNAQVLAQPALACHY